MRNPLRALFDRKSAIATSADLARELLSGWRKSTTGQTVSEDSALRIAAVTTCVDIRSSAVASLPLGVYERLAPTGKRPAPDHWLGRVLSQPNKWQTRFEFVQGMEVYLLLYRNAYAWINWAGNGIAMELIPLHPSQMRVEQRDEFSPPQYTLTKRNGGEVRFRPDEVLHLRGLSTNSVTGRDGLNDGRDMIGLAQVLQEHAGTFFANGGRPDVLLKHPKTLSDKAKLNLETSWEKSYGGNVGQRRVAVVEEGMDAMFPNISNEASQFLETRSMSRGEIAGWFRVPPHMIGDTEKSTSWGTGIEQQQIGFLTFTVQPDLELWEQRINRALLMNDPRVFAEFNIKGFLRGDNASRAQFYKTMREIGAMNANEVRELENMNPRDGGDAYDDLAYAVGKQSAGSGPKDGGTR